MKKALVQAAKTAKSLHPVVWVAALIIPGGFMAIAAYTAVKTYRGNNDRSKNRSR